MNKPYTFAGNVVKRGGKQITSDYPQPQKFFHEFEGYYSLLDNIPFSAVEDLSLYDNNRELILKSMHKLFRICWAAKIDIIKEIGKVEQDPFEGLEEDLAIKKIVAN